MLVFVDELTDHARRVSAIYPEDFEPSTEQIAAKLAGYKSGWRDSYSSANGRLSRLEKRGFVRRRRGRHQGGWHSTWSLTEKGREVLYG